MSIMSSLQKHKLNPKVVAMLFQRERANSAYYSMLWSRHSIQGLDLPPLLNTQAVQR